MIKNKELYNIVLLVIIGCLIMAYVDAILSPNYAIKSLLKLNFFLIIPIGYSFINKKISFRNLFIFDKKRILLYVLFGCFVYVFILSAYFILGPYFDFSNITKTLENNIGVNKGNFVLVAVYISFINSLLEEFFFRGFAFLSLKKFTNRKVSYLFSASAFSLYHISIMINWFTPFLFIILILSLFVAGLMFNWLNERNDNIYTSWMVHLFSNLAINTIGFILFKII